MTAEQTIQESYPFYDPMIYGKDVELCGEQVIELMSSFAKQESIEFAKWQIENDWEWSVSQRSKGQEDFWYVPAGDGVYLTTEKLYEKYLQSKTQ
jgi:hypothetical protein